MRRTLYAQFEAWQTWCDAKRRTFCSTICSAPSNVGMRKRFLYQRYFGRKPSANETCLDWLHNKHLQPLSPLWMTATANSFFGRISSNVFYVITFLLDNKIVLNQNMQLFVNKRAGRSRVAPCVLLSNFQVAFCSGVRTFFQSFLYQPVTR